MRPWRGGCREERGRNDEAICNRRDMATRWPNARGWVAREERPARSDAEGAGAAGFLSLRWRGGWRV